MEVCGGGGGMEVFQMGDYILIVIVRGCHWGLSFIEVVGNFEGFQVHHPPLLSPEKEYNILALGKSLCCDCCTKRVSYALCTRSKFNCLFVYMLSKHHFER